MNEKIHELIRGYRIGLENSGYQIAMLMTFPTRLTLSLALKSAPELMRRLMISGQLFLAAQCNGVLPSYYTIAENPQKVLQDADITQNNSDDIAKQVYSSMPSIHMRELKLIITTKEATYEIL